MSMPPIVTYGESGRPCPPGACECGVTQYPELRPDLTQDQYNGTISRSLVQLTCRGVANIFGGAGDTGDAIITAERAKDLLEHITVLSGGTSPRIQKSPIGHLEVIYFLNTHGNMDLPVLPGICRNGPLKSISRILLHAHNSGFLTLESTVMGISDDLV